MRMSCLQPAAAAAAAISPGRCLTVRRWWWWRCQWQWQWQLQLQLQLQWQLRRQLQRQQQQRWLTVLGIETSCDDTSIALLDSNDRNHSSASLIFHETITSGNKSFGGIHPLVSLESHHRNLAPLLQKHLRQAPDVIAATRGPGMMSSVSVGLDTAKGLALAFNRPLVGVHHMQAHALTPRLVSALEGTQGVEFPFLTLLVSGGHTMLVESRGLVDHQIVAQTIDIAVGDMLDKASRAILPAEVLGAEGDTVAYAAVLERWVFGGERPEAEYQYWPPRSRERAMQERNKSEELADKFSAPLRMKEKGGKFDAAFSFSGLGSQVDRFFEKREDSVSDEVRKAVGRETMTLAFEHLASRVVNTLGAAAADERPPVEARSLVVSGGVASNRFLRQLLQANLNEAGLSNVRLVVPPPKYCTDNAAMIAWAGLEMYRAGWTSELSILPLRRWSLDSGASQAETTEAAGSGAGAPRGVLGADGWKSASTERVTNVVSCS